MNPTIEQLNAMTEADAIEATLRMAEHPEGYEGPCECQQCLSDYGEPEENP